ncbi:MAG: hypothetical protein JO081_14335 [Alphaproteobacteria bacterium]|nr:hypothetical protein [Alphaproteobacteria bacterium]
MRFLSSLSPAIILRQLRERQDAATFERLQFSQHVADLRLIFSVAVIIMIGASLLAIPFFFERELMNNWADIRNSTSSWIWLRLAFAAVVDSGAFIGAVWAVGCGVLAWTYQTGSGRLGVVDLFACEIATLCRVAAVVDMVPHYIDLFHSGPHPAEHDGIDAGMPTVSTRFTSQESYFPVFDASVKDLQQLEADVVDNVTAFYTYLKVMRDSLRKLAGIRPPEQASPGRDEWHRAICNVVYMQFLALESGRKAINELVEFQPTRAENTFTILLSEITAYGFLREQFQGDLRHRLLEAREAYYRDKVLELCAAVAREVDPRWDKAKEVAREVMQRHSKLFAVEAPAAEPQLAVA